MPFIHSSSCIYFLSKESEQKPNDIIDDIKLLGDVKYSDESKKLLEKQYFIDLIALVRVHTGLEFKADKAEMIK